MKAKITNFLVTSDKTYNYEEKKTFLRFTQLIVHCIKNNAKCKWKQK